MLKICIRCVCVLAFVNLVVGCASMLEKNSEQAIQPDNNSQISNSNQPHSQSAPEILAKDYKRAIWLAKSNRLDESIQLLNDITKNNPDFSRAYTNLGLLHIQQNDLLAAEQALTQAVKLHSRDAVALNHLGVVFRKLGKFNHAKIAYLSAIKYNKDYAEAYYNLGILNDIYLHDLQEAHKNYQMYLSLNPEKNSTVEKWIVDLSRRISKQNKAFDQKS